MTKLFTAVARVFASTLVVTAPMEAPAVASTVSDGIISATVMLRNRAFMIATSGTKASPMACNTQHRFAINAIPPVGQAQMSLLITAAIARKTVSIAGTGTCSVWADSETIAPAHK